MKKRALLLLPGLLLLLTGCARPVHARELSMLQPVQTLGFDGEPGAVVISASDSPGDRGEDSLRLSARGESVVRAAEELRNFGAREELFFAHAAYVLVGEEATRSGIGEVLDWFERSTQTRLRLPLFLVRDGDARTLVTGSRDEDYEITALLKALEATSRREGEVVCPTLLETARALAEDGTALCCALAAVTAEENTLSAETGTLLPRAAGYGVLKDGALAGWLDLPAARGTTILLNKAGEISYALPEGAGVATLTLRSCQTKLTPLRDGEGLFFRAEIDVRAALTGLTESGGLTRARLQKLEAGLEDIIMEETGLALASEKALRADFLHLRAAAERSFSVSAKDGEAFLKNLRWEILPQVRIERRYDVTGAPGREGGGERG